MGILNAVFHKCAKFLFSNMVFNALLLKSEKQELTWSKCIYTSSTAFQLYLFSISLQKIAMLHEPFTSQKW